ncbi:MAG: CHAT domain-containing protein [Cyanobacteria bacterium P01_C01_bin.118]
MLPAAIGVSAQVANESPAEAARLLEQGGQEYRDQQHDLAERTLQDSLRLHRALGDQNGEAWTLNYLGLVYFATGKNDEAIDVNKQALEIYERLQQKNGMAQVLSVLGQAYDAKAEYAVALEQHEKALKLFKEIKDDKQVAWTYLHLGRTYNSLAQYNQSIEFYQKALNLFRSLGNRWGESDALKDLGFVYFSQSRHSDAINLYQQALPIFNDIGNPSGEGYTRIQMGLAYTFLSQYDEAIAQYNQALPIFEQIEDSKGKAHVLMNMGNTYRAQSQHEPAMRLYQEAIPLFYEFKDREGQALIFKNIGELYVEQGDPELGIISLKQSVNTYERIRSGLVSLDQDLQDSFASTVEATYRTLAETLLEQGRIPEAQQVLDLLKLEELREFTDTRAVWASDGISFSNPEQAVVDVHGSLIALGSNVVECELNDCAELNTLLKQQQSLLAQYKTELSRFVETIRANRRDDNNFQDLDNISVDARELLDAYAADEQNSLLVYPFVLEDKLWLVWVTVGDVVGSIEVPVSQGELATTVQKFGALLKSRSSNMDELQATSQKLHSWIIQPLADELEKNDIDHLVFVNDRVTRYIPMGALYNGENYLLERYTVSTVLSTTFTDMDDRLGPVTDSNVLGLGLTEAVGDFIPLPAVRDELAGIIEDQDGDGIYPGQTFLNQDFTLDAFKNNLRGNRILHMATHAAFVPGQPKESFIVLGDGYRLEIPEIETMTRRLKDLHLVVLSACQTALGETNQEDGTEIAGLSSYFLEANRSGAVVASLWNVNDNSTSVLMQRFYENMAAGETKADALRKAQLSLLGSDQTADGDERIIGQRQADDAGTAPLSHPYFWAPFILIGNGL